MKERPILFSGEMVRALLENRKSQTRRVVKPQPECLRDVQALQFHVATEEPLAIGKGCPYGRPGDRLWVKETHHVNHTGEVVHYRADYPVDGDPFNADECGEDHGLEGEKWRPSIFCRRQHSRITLEVVAVRVERLQDIGEADALAEGIFRASEALGFYMYDSKGTPGPHCCDTARDTYTCLWESINGPGSWALNPWVWVIEFKRIGGAK